MLVALKTAKASVTDQIHAWDLKYLQPSCMSLSMVGSPSARGGRPGRDIRAKQAAASRKDAASAAIAQPPPTEAVSSPATVGPRMRAVFPADASRELAC